MNLQLSIAMADNPRTRPILEQKTKPDGITLGHPSGTLLVAAKFEAEGSVSEATVFRTARRIMEGQVFWKGSR